MNILFIFAYQHIDFTDRDHKYYDF